jgi:hypothetical protein
MKPKWVAAIAFWVLLLVSLGLNERYQWVGRAWSVGLWLILLATLITFLTNSIRHYDENRTLAGSGRGYPRWFTRFAYDEDEEAHARTTGKDSSHKQ